MTDTTTPGLPADADTGWLTPARRQAIQGLGAVVVTGLATLGLVTEGQGSAILQLIAGLIAVGTALLAMAHLNRTQQATWLSANLRSVFYSIALAGAAVALAFNVVDQGRINHWLVIISVVLTVAQQLIAVVNAPASTAALAVDAPPVTSGGIPGDVDVNQTTDQQPTSGTVTVTAGSDPVYTPPTPAA